MFNIGIGELLFIAVLALIVLGPDRLPKVMRQLGEYARILRTTLANFNAEFAEELKPINEIRSLAQDLNPMRQIGAVIEGSQPTPTIAPPGAPPASPASRPGDQRLPTNPMVQLRGVMTAGPAGGSAPEAAATPLAAGGPEGAGSSQPSSEV